jgi:hypothetical protein
VEVTEMKNTLAYYYAELITGVKRFTVHALGGTFLLNSQKMCKLLQHLNFYHTMVAFINIPIGGSA